MMTAVSFVLAPLHVGAQSCVRMRTLTSFDGGHDEGDHPNRHGSEDLLELREINKPTVGDDQMLVRVRAASDHVDVWHVMRGASLGRQVGAQRMTRESHGIRWLPFSPHACLVAEAHSAT